MAGSKPFDGGHPLPVAGLAGCPVAGQRSDGLASAGDLLFGRKDSLLRIAPDQVVDSRHVGLHIAVAHQREQFRNLDPQPSGRFVRGALRLGPQQGEHRQRSSRLSVVEGLHGGQLHRLYAGHFGAGPVARRGGQQGEEQSERSCHADAPAGRLPVAAPEQVPGADPDDEQGGQQERRGDGVEKLVDSNGREEHFAERGHLVAHGLHVEPAADGALHPGVGYQDPEGREVGADGREPGGGEVEALRDLVPAEEHHGDEGRLQKKAISPSMASGAPKMSPTKWE